jgi:hypothetical protein
MTIPITETKQQLFINIVLSEIKKHITKVYSFAAMIQSRYKNVHFSLI